MISDRNKRVILGMSGGIDSSVSALLLKDKGYEPVGTTFQLAPQGDSNKEGAIQSSNNADTPSQDILDAKAVCEKIHIEHVYKDYRPEFSEKIIATFCDSYLQGKTPNPCVDCNRMIKFPLLDTVRKEMKCAYMATGHYARIEYNPKTDRYMLLRATDHKKDQSYFLYNLTQEYLAHTIFPLGNYTKPEIREIAKTNGFPNAQKQESQDICFIKEGNYLDFIEQYRGLPENPGTIKNRNGDILGTHKGLAHYTVGQRKGIGIAYKEPLYVYKKDVENNELLVDTDLNTLCMRVVIHKVNYVSETHLSSSHRYFVKCHYREEPKEIVIVEENTSSIQFEFIEPHRAVAPGQSAVIYRDDMVVCGGVINYCQ